MTKFPLILIFIFSYFQMMSQTRPTSVEGVLRGKDEKPVKANNRIYSGNDGLATASMVQAYSESFTHKPGWNWLSFPRIERYKNETFDAIPLLKRINPWPPDYLEMIYKPDGILPQSIIFANGDWDLSGLNILKSTRGYKLFYEKNTLDFSLRLEGAKLDYDTPMDLVEGKNWVGYFLDTSIVPEDCLPTALWDVLTQIKTQYWTMTKKPGSDPPWFIKGDKAPFKYGDLVVLITDAPFEGFQWQAGGPVAVNKTIPQASFYTYTEQADYIPIYVETDSTSDILEIAVVADGLVRGAAVRRAGDTLVEVNAYLQGVQQGSSVEFQTWNGFKSQSVEKGAYVVIDYARNRREKRNIYVGEKASFYSISLKSKEVYELPPDISTLSCKPNPFKQNLKFSFRLNRGSLISLGIFDLSGKPVRTIINGYFPEGLYRFTWKGDSETGSPMSPGVYFYKLSTGNGTFLTDKIVMIKQ